MLAPHATFTRALHQRKVHVKWSGNFLAFDLADGPFFSTSSLVKEDLSLDGS